MKQLKIGAYVRVSTEEQAAVVDGSLDNQKYRINAFADLKNVQEPSWGKIVEYYVDDGYSAKDTRRPAFQRMVSDIRRGKIDLVLVTDLSRLSRNIPDFCGILDLLKGKDASFLSIKEQFDTSTPIGKMMLFIMINLAQFEREQTAERVALGCHARAMRGLLNGGHSILGYDKNPDKKSTYVVNGLEAEQVKVAFKTFLECSTINRTAEKLQELGIRPKVKRHRSEKIVERGLWTHQTLGDLLRNPSYIGLKEVNRKFKNADPRSVRPHQKYQLVKASWPAIVDRKTFDAVQRLLDENKVMERRRRKGAERRVFIASGVLRCKECGRPMIGSAAHGAKAVHRYYAHSYSKGDVITCSIKRIRAEEVEQAISNHIVHALRDGKYLDKIAERIAEQSKDLGRAASPLKANLKKELKDTEREMENAFKFQVKAAPESEAEQFFVEKIEILGQKKAALRKELDTMESTASNVISLEEARQDLEDRVGAIQRGWLKLPAIQKKRALRRLVKTLLIGPGVIDIHYYSNAFADEGALGSNSLEKEDGSKVLPFKAGGTHARDSKLLVQNCLSARLAIPA